MRYTRVIPSTMTRSLVMGNKSVTIVCVLCIICFASEHLCAARYPYSNGIVGAIREYRVQPKESLFEIARTFDLGQNAITDANPGADRFVPPPGTLIRIPTAWLLPEVPLLDGIIINVPEFRLYYFSRHNSGNVVTFPIGIGDQGKNTPVGNFRVIEKIVQPPWYVPASIRQERPFLPDIVPPGPDNPMGSHALRLSLRTILIHGTNRPWGIGTRSSHGCIRLYPEDISQLFGLVRKGTRVTIVQQPIKAVAKGDRIFIEVHRYEDGDYWELACEILGKKNLLGRVDVNKLIRVLQEKSGMPEDITRTLD